MIEGIDVAWLKQRISGNYWALDGQKTRICVRTGIYVRNIVYFILFTEVLNEL